MIAVGFRRREPPLEPAAVVGRGAIASSLVRALLARSDAALAGLRGVAAADLVLIEGEAAALPWVDGVGYLGRDPEAPSLLVPTLLVPSVPSVLLERALVRLAPPPLAILVDDEVDDASKSTPGPAVPRLVSLAGARSIDRPTLRQWLTRHGAAAIAAAPPLEDGGGAPGGAR